jgi:hypothetical protein
LMIDKHLASGSFICSKYELKVDVNCPMVISVRAG